MDNMRTELLVNSMLKKIERQKNKPRPSDSRKNYQKRRNDHAQGSKPSPTLHFKPGNSNVNGDLTG